MDEFCEHFDDPSLCLRCKALRQAAPAVASAALAARANGVPDRAPADLRGIPGPRDARDPLPHEPLSELGFAHRLIEVHGDRLRYVPVWRRWLCWDGKRWMHDTSGEAERCMKHVVRSVTADAALVRDEKERRALLHVLRRAESASGVKGALTLAGTHERLALRPEDLDTDPYLLNVQNGILDLRTGELSPHDPGRHLTKVAGAAYDPAAPGVEFGKFLARVQPDPEMRTFLARLLGHALSGVVAEHVLPILYGAGANGKSTLLDQAVCPALGDYASAADPAIFTDRGHDAHPTGVADLFGRRLVVVQETDRGRHLAEGTVKRLTGGDQIKARRMHEDFWEFRPSHTAVMSTNHRPLVRGTDEGIWRRLRLVPFDVVIPAEERDAELADRLRLELDAVLTWLVDGYRDWRDQGLREPAQVTDATALYRTDSDALGRFLEQRCVLHPTMTVGSTALFEEWKRWCTGENHDPGSATGFARDLQGRGLDNRKDRTGRMRWHGLGLSTTDEEG